MHPPRQLRDALILGVVWVILWTAIAKDLGVIGLYSGALFAMWIALAERGRRVREIGRGRAVIWGVLASAAFPLLSGREDEVLLSCAVGALVAFAIVTLARKAAPAPSP